MDLNDILDNHCVMHDIECTADTPSAYYELDYTTDIFFPEYVDHDVYLHINMPFVIDNDVAYSGGDKYCLRFKFYWTETITFKGAQCHYLYLYLKFEDAIAGRYKLKWMIKGGSADTSYETSSPYEFIPQVNYMYNFRFKRTSATNLELTINLYEIDADGNLEWLDNFNLSAITGNNIDTIYYFRDYFYPNGVPVSMKLFECEGHVSHNALQTDAIRLFRSIPRLFDYTYYPSENDLFVNYVFPPYPAFEGCAYDRTRVLNERIDDLGDDVDDLTADLIVAQTHIETLESELAEGGTFWEWLTSVTKATSFMDKLKLAVQGEQRKLFEIVEGS